MDTKQILVSELIKSAENELSAKGYSVRGKSGIITTFRQFQDYANKCGVLYYTPELNEHFFSEYCGKTSTVYNNRPWTKATITRKRGALKRLDWMYKYGYIVKCNQQMLPPFPPHYAHIMGKFDNWQVKRNYASNTVEASNRTLRPFIKYLSEQNIDNVEDLQASHLSDYVVTLRGHAAATMKGDLGRIRVFLRFLYLEKLTSKNMAEFVPDFHYGNSPRESNIWTKEELSQVLDSIDRSSSTGKRDYAASLLAIDLGIRSEDIVNLKLNDIHWENPPHIRFVQFKTKNGLSLPLTERAGLAIIDYFKYGRPETDCQNVFVKHIPPYDAMSGFSSHFSRRVSQAGIPKKINRKYGVHSLRHTVATRMLENGVEFDQIAPFLGHADENTLHVYLNSDIEHLRQCALSFEPEVTA